MTSFEFRVETGREIGRERGGGTSKLKLKQFNQLVLRICYSEAGTVLGSGELKMKGSLDLAVETGTYICFFLQYDAYDKKKGLWELRGGTGNSPSQLGYKVQRKGGGILVKPYLRE